MAQHKYDVTMWQVVKWTNNLIALVGKINFLPSSKNFYTKIHYTEKPAFFLRKELQVKGRWTLYNRNFLSQMAV